MAAEHPATEVIDASRNSPVAQPAGRQRRMKVTLLLASIVFSVAAFLALDWVRTAVIQRRSGTNGGSSPCRMRDPVRHHAFRPKCAATHQWGGNSYEFLTNNLGFRDEKVRDVPLADPKPRILVLGDSFTEGKVAWRDTYFAKIASHFPQYDFLNGGVSSYAPSNYLNVARMVLAAGVDIDEVIVFPDISDVQDEAAFYRDKDASGAVTGPVQQDWTAPWYERGRYIIAQHMLLTNYILDFMDRYFVRYGYYNLAVAGYTLDTETSAWTYRKVNETAPYIAGYAPLGVEGGIAKEKAKMDVLWKELQARNIPISIVVYPYPAQVLHDTADSRQVQIWRQWCEGKCKRFISVFPPFIAAKQQCPASTPGCWYLTYFIFGDDHYNAAGNALVAGAVIESMTDDPPRKRVAITEAAELSSER